MIYDEIRQYKEGLDRLLGRINEKKYSKQNQAEKSNIIDVYSDNLSLGLVTFIINFLIFIRKMTIEMFVFGFMTKEKFLTDFYS